MSSDRQHMPSSREIEDSLGNRISAAFVSLLFSLPAAALLWFLFNSQLGLFTNAFIPASYLAIGVIGFAVASYAFPRVAPSAVGRLYEFLLWVGKGW